MTAYLQGFRRKLLDRLDPILDSLAGAVTVLICLALCPNVKAQDPVPSSSADMPPTVSSVSSATLQYPPLPPDPSRIPEAGRIFSALRDFALRSDDPEIRLGYVSRFAGTWNDTALISMALRDPDHRVWAEAVQQLMFQRRINTSFVPDLTAHLDSPVARARLVAVDALQRLVPWTVPDTLPRLSALLRDQDLTVRSAALRTLEAFGTAAAAAALPVLESPPSSPEDPSWLSSVALATWKIDPRHTDPVAWLLLRPPGWASRVAVTKAAASMAGLAYADDPIAGLAWVVKWGSDQVWPQSLPVVTTWADGLGGNVYAPQTRAENLTKSLVARLEASNSNPEVCATLIEAIGHFHQAGKSALPALRRALAQEEDVLHRLQLAATIVRIEPDDREAVDLLWTTAVGPDASLGDMAIDLWIESIGSSPSRVMGPYVQNLVQNALSSGEHQMTARAWPLAVSLPFACDQSLAERLLPRVLQRLKSGSGADFSGAVRAAGVLDPTLKAADRVTVVRVILDRLADRNIQIRKTVTIALASEVVTPDDVIPTPMGVVTPSPIFVPQAPRASSRDATTRLPAGLESEIVDSLRRSLAASDTRIKIAMLSVLPTAFLIRDEYRTRYLDALAERMNDESRPVRTLALELCIESKLWRPPNAPLPAFSDKSWKQFIENMGIRLRSQDLTARREAVNELRHLTGLSFPDLDRPSGMFIWMPEMPNTADARRAEITRILVPALGGADPTTIRVVARAIRDVEFGLQRDASPLLAAWRAVAGTERGAGSLHLFAAELERVTGDNDEARAAWRLALTTSVQSPQPAIWADVVSDFGLLYDKGHPDLARRLIDEFTGVLERGTPDEQRGAALGLVRLASWFDETQAATILRFLLKHPDPVVRRRMSQALSQWLVRVAPAPQAPARIAPYDRNSPLWPPPPGSRPQKLLTDPTHDPELAWETIVSRVLDEILNNNKYDTIYYSVVPPSQGIGNAHADILNPDDGAENSELGLALLIETEPVRPDGDRLPISERPMTGPAKIRLQPPRTLGEFWAQMIGKPPGRYRMTLIVFWPPSGELPVGDDLGSTGRLADDMAHDPFWWETAKDAQVVLNSLPNSMKKKRVGHGNVWVVFYDFIRKPKQGGLEQVGSGENALLSLKKAELNGLLEVGRVSLPKSVRKK